LYKILITARIFPTLKELMAKVKMEGLEIVDNPYMGQTLSEENLLEIIAGVEACLVGDDYFTRKVLEKADSLKVIAKFGVGVDRIDLQAATEHGIIVANAPGTNKHAVADMTMGLILALARKIPYSHNKVVNEGFWKVITGTEVYGKTLGIMGLGQIGREVARRANGFAMKLLAYEPFPDQEFVNKYDVKLVSMAELFKEADFISLNLPSLPTTKGIINKETLALVKPGAFIINTARGDIVDDQALYEALVSGRLAGAALDVLATEPPPKDHPLFKLENVILTPHVGAHTYEAQLRAGTMALENILRVLRGEKPLYQVNL
jgi:D-3-phosphoglycerate dehydrogenase